MMVQSEYLCQLSSGLFTLQQKQILCDVTFTADDGTLLAHSAVLAAVSDFIRGQFEQLTTTDPRTEYSLHLPGCNVATLDTVLRLLYTGNVKLKDRQELAKVLEVCYSLGVQLDSLSNISVTLEAESSTQPVYM